MSETQDQWFYARGTQQQGPVDVDTLRRMIAAGQVVGTDLAWRDGMPNWQPVSSIPELLVPTPAAVPPAPPVEVATISHPNAAQQNGGTIPYSQPMGYQFPPDEQTRQLQSQASTALVLGILSLVLSACVCGPLGVGLGIWAWVVGSKIPPGYPFSGQGKAGLICGIIGTILGGISSIFHVLWVIGMFVGGI